jgi:uncharacterized membrane protein YbhN (UPF0104 family)
MIDAIFNGCVLLLLFLADLFGISYKAINVWVFVIIWPVVTLVLINVVIRQWRRNRALLRVRDEMTEKSHEGASR